MPAAPTGTGRFKAPGTGLENRKQRQQNCFIKVVFSPEVRPCKLRSRVSLALSRGQGRAFGPLAQLSLFLLGFGVIVIIVQVLGKYMIVRYLDP